MIALGKSSGEDWSLPLNLLRMWMIEPFNKSRNIAAAAGGGGRREGRTSRMQYKKLYRVFPPKKNLTCEKKFFLIIKRLQILL